nr:zinc finger, CCHC-type [Tanacetum cinerariifolium]
MASMNTRPNIENLMDILYKIMEVQNKLSSDNLILVLKQESVEYMMKNVFGLRWNCKELKEIMKLRAVIMKTEVPGQEGAKGNAAKRYREDSNEAACAVVAAILKEDMDVQSDVYVLSNGYRKSSDNSHDYYYEYALGMFIQLFLYIDGMVFSCGCKAEIKVTKGLIVKAKGNILDLEIIREQSGNTLSMSQSRIHNEKLVQTLLKGHSTLSLEDSLSGDCDLEKNGKWSYIYAVRSQDYQVVCTRPDIESARVDMLDGFNRGLQTNIQVFVDFDYAMGRATLTESFSIIDTFNGNRVQATVKGKHMSKFQLLLDEGACCRIGNLGVGENSRKWPLLNHKYKLNFFQGTTITRVGSFDNNPHGFNFEHFTAFTARKFTETELCDAIGTVVSVSDAIPFNNYGKDKLRRTIIPEDKYEESLAIYGGGGWGWWWRRCLVVMAVGRLGGGEDDWWWWW